MYMYLHNNKYKNYIQSTQNLFKIIFESKLTPFEYIFNDCVRPMYQ